jgi:hypothetical protein
LEVSCKKCGDVEGEAVVGPALGVQRGCGGSGGGWGVGLGGFGKKTSGGGSELVVMDFAMGGMGA